MALCASWLFVLSPPLWSLSGKGWGRQAVPPGAAQGLASAAAGAPAWRPDLPAPPQRRPSAPAPQPFAWHTPGYNRRPAPPPRCRFPPPARQSTSVLCASSEKPPKKTNFRTQSKYSPRFYISIVYNYNICVTFLKFLRAALHCQTISRILSLKGGVMMKYPRITIRVGESMLQQLQTAAAEAHCSVGALVRTAITWYLINLHQK